MSRRPIQVPTEVLEEMTEYRSNLYATSHHELITRLIEEHRKYAALKEEIKQTEIIEKQRQADEMVQLGTESKAKFNEIKEELRLKSDVSVFEFLREHYQNSMDISNMTFMYYRKLIENEKESRWN